MCQVDKRYENVEVLKDAGLSYLTSKPVYLNPNCIILAETQSVSNIKAVFEVNCISKKGPAQTRLISRKIECSKC